MDDGEHKFYRSVEGLVFLTGCGLFAAELLILVLFQRYIPESRENVISVIVADLLTGRAGSISLGLKLGLSRVSVILISVAFNLTLLLVLYPLIAYSYKHYVEAKLIGKALDSTKRAAEKHLGRTEKWGALGIAVFVWIPLFSTGSLVGATIGTLMGMHTIVVLCVVVPAMIASAVSWTFAFDYVFDYARSVGRIAPLVLVCLIFGAVAVHHIHRLRTRGGSKSHRS